MPAFRMVQPKTTEAKNTVGTNDNSLSDARVRMLPYIVAATFFMEYLDTMFKGVDNMLLIQGTGVEYLTTVA